LLNCVAPICGVDWSGEGWSHRVAPAELQGLFAGWHSTVTRLASEAPEEKTAKWALFDRDPIPEWVQGRVALVGDSAHPMLPFLGLGAATGIEDAVILGRAFGLESDVAAALKRYEAARVGRAGEMLLDSRRQAQVFADGPGSTRGPKTTMKERMDYDPATVAI